MTAHAQAVSLKTVDRLHAAMNEHDLEAFLAAWIRTIEASNPFIRLEDSEVGSRSKRTGRHCSRSYPISTPGCSPPRRRVTPCGPNGIGPAPERMKPPSTCEG
jgi:hypothetical protein